MAEVLNMEVPVQKSGTILNDVLKLRSSIMVSNMLSVSMLLECIFCYGYLHL